MALSSRVSLVFGFVFMDMNHKVAKSEAGADNDLNGFQSPKAVVIQEIDANDESQPLLPSINDRFSLPPEKSKRKVQWVDWNGDKLAQIVEFIPSDVSDEDEDDSDSCVCRIM